MKFRKLALCMLAGVLMLSLPNVITYAAEEATAIQVQDSLIEIGLTKQDALKEILEQTAQVETKDIVSTSISPSEDITDETAATQDEVAEEATTEQEPETTQEVTASEVTEEATDQEDEDKEVVAKKELTTKTEKTAAKEKKQEAEEAGRKYTKAELRLLSALIYCEAGGESYNGKLAVGIVVMNRVRSGRFPNTVKDVIYQKFQFSPARNGSLKRALAEYDNGKFTSEMELDCIKAAKAALSGTTTITVKGEKVDFSKYLFFSGRLKGYTYKLGNHQFK